MGALGHAALLRTYVVREVLAPFFAWTAFLCVMFFVMAFLKGTEVLLGSAVTLGDFARFATYLVPQFLVQAVPIAFLLAILLGLGRLAEDGELRAMQALGVSPAVLLRGPVLLGVALAGVLALLMSTAQPWGQTMVRVAAQDIIRRNLMNDIKSGTFHEEVLGFTLYAEQVGEGGEWSHVLLHDGRDADQPLLVVARAGRVAPTQWHDAVNFELEDGSVHRPSRSSDAYATVGFEHATLRAGIAEAFLQKNQFQTAREERSPGELLDAARDAERRGESPRPFEVTFHWRLGQMLMPLAFAFLGAPLAILRRAGRAWGFLFTLAGYVGFYLVARVAVQLGDAGTVPPAVAGQLPNVLFIGAGLAAMAWVVRRGAA